jgi:hypothetical protein
MAEGLGAVGAHALRPLVSVLSVASSVLGIPVFAKSPLNPGQNVIGLVALSAAASLGIPAKWPDHRLLNLCYSLLLDGEASLTWALLSSPMLETNRRGACNLTTGGNERKVGGMW